MILYICGFIHWYVWLQGVLLFVSTTQHVTTCQVTNIHVCMCPLSLYIENYAISSYRSKVWNRKTRRKNILMHIFSKNPFIQTFREIVKLFYLISIVQQGWKLDFTCGPKGSSVKKNSLCNVHYHVCKGPGLINCTKNRTLHYVIHRE